ncbi:MAG: sugar porter family MFS transporter [Saprospiraceae bacterium]|nr:sugar porter family MFS transporter [Saprospiraceae bacterium]
MKSGYYLNYCAIVASMSGFLFGFDTVVISGAEQEIQKLWQLSSLMHGLAISMALWGTVLGSLIGGIPSDYWGRKPSLMLVGLLFLLSALGSAIATDVYTFIIFRFLGGVGIGISTIAAPVYIAEISPPQNRGRLTGFFQFNIVLGILIAYVSNAMLSHLGSDSWRFMLGVQALPSVVFMLLALKLPESPRWLVTKKNSLAQAEEIFKKLDQNLSKNELSELINQISSSAALEKQKNSFFSNSLFKPILLAFFIAVFNQLSGINAILYFAPRIFEMTGLGQQASLLQSIGIGLVNLVFTFIGLWLIDRVGRRTLLYWGGIGYVISLGLCSWAFATEHFSIVSYCIFGFIAAHAIGQGAVIWVFISEIFPNRHRDSGQSLGSATHWIFAALLTLIFPNMVAIWSPSVIFGVFCGFMMLQLIWIKLWVPETKGIALEDMDVKL